MIQIAVCDDNQDDLARMVSLLDRFKTIRNYHFENFLFTSGLELLSALEKGKRFDVYCLDILMPGYSGMDVAREIRTFDKTAPIVFFTSSAEYALEGYSVKAVNYILKPVSEEKLIAAFDELLEQLGEKAEETAIVVKSNEGLQKIVITSLVYAEVIGRNVLYHLRSGKVVACTEPFAAACEKILPFGCFVKTHRSYIVNMQYIDTVDNHQVTLQTLSTVPIAQGKAREVKQQYLAYQMEEE